MLTFDLVGQVKAPGKTDYCIYFACPLGVMKCCGVKYRVSIQQRKYILITDNTSEQKARIEFYISLKNHYKQCKRF